MTQLSEQIMDIGDKVLELESGPDLFAKLTSEGTRSSSVPELLEMASRPYFLFVELARQNGLIRTSPSAPLKTQTGKEDKNLYLGLRLLEHDILGIMGTIQELGGIFLSYRKKSQADQIKAALGRFQSFFTYGYENVRIALLLIPYIATADSGFLVSVDSGNVPSLLEQMVHGPRLSCEFSGCQTISSDEYFVICQLAKNASRNLAAAGVKDSIEVIITDEARQRVLTVADRGTGIPTDKLPLIFYGYTTGGTGVGLQVVKRLADLRHGYVMVRSAVEGQPTFTYDSREQSAIEERIRKNTGTTFEVHLPKQTAT